MTLDEVAPEIDERSRRGRTAIVAGEPASDEARRLVAALTATRRLPRPT